MAEIFVEIKEENPNRRALNALLALITGILTLSMPDVLFVIIAAYLIANGLIYVFGKSALFIGSGSIVIGIFIFAFPDLIPYAFAAFLLILSLGTILSVGLSLLGIVAFICALIIISNPSIVSYVVAAFLLFYGVLGLIAWLKAKR